jgi:hypothetical protein
MFEGFKSRCSTPAVVRGLNGLGHSADTSGGAARRERPFPQGRRQAAARDELHAVEVPPFVLAHFMNGHDARMPQARGGGRLGAETRDVLGPRPRAGPDEFERDDAAEALLPCLINDAHAAAPDFSEQFVVAQFAGSRRVGHGHVIGQHEMNRRARVVRLVRFGRQRFQSPPQQATRADAAHGIEGEGPRRIQDNGAGPESSR